MESSAEIPGPRGLPLLGSLPALARDPLDFVTQVSREHGGIARYHVSTRPHWLITDPEAIGAVLIGLREQTHKDVVTSSLSRLLGRGLVTSEDPLWRRQRRLAAPSFRPSHLAAYGQAMVEAAAAGSRAVQPGPRDVLRDTTRITLQIVLETLFGSAEPAGERVGEAIGDFMGAFEEELRSARRLLPRWVPTRGRRRVRRARDVIEEALSPIIPRERAAAVPGAHLLGRLIAARDDSGEGMSDVQLRDESVTIFAAGHETTSLALSYALWLLARRPALQEDLAEERARLPADRSLCAADLPALSLHRAVIREAMRLYPPAWMVGRTTLCDVVVGGYPIPRGAQILIPQWVVHRDPRWWTDPLDFRPERWQEPGIDALPRFAYFPFGGGARVCVGEHFAVLEAVLILAILLADHRFAPVPGATLELMPAVTLRPRNGVWLDVSRR